MRRSDTAGPKKFVSIDGVVVANLCRLCPQHHREVTGGIGGHRARIVWRDDPLGHWVWQTPSPVNVLRFGETVPIRVGTNWHDIGPLKGIEGMYTEEEISFG